MSEFPLAGCGLRIAEDRCDWPPGAETAMAADHGPMYVRRSAGGRRTVISRGTLPAPPLLSLDSVLISAWCRQDAGCCGQCKAVCQPAHTADRG